MTVQEFARLCACKPQTLRYYDRIGLLKPAQVDPWTGYRRYEPAQAMDFVKIKNLQAADFSIQEIMALLARPDAQVYAAFDAKIAEQEEKLANIRKIQQTYLAEKTMMDKIVHSMTDYLLRQCRRPEVLREFGMDPADAPAVLERLRMYMNRMLRENVSSAYVSMTVNDEVIRGEEAVLEHIQTLSEENLGDTILLNDGFGTETEQSADPAPDFSHMEVVWEKRGWAHVYEFIDDLPHLERGKEYCLWVRTMDADLDGDLSFAMFMMGAVLHKQQIEDIVVNCSATTAGGTENRFKLLCKK